MFKPERVLKSLFLWTILLLLGACSKTGTENTHLGLKPPGLNPEPMRAGNLSGPGHSSLGLAILPESEEIFYTEFADPFKIMYTGRVKGGWTQPQTAGFSGHYRDWDITAASDGQRLYFTSTRPLNDSDSSKTDADIWYVEKKENQWSEPVNIGPPVNTLKNEVHPSVADNGNLYFFAVYDTNRVPNIYLSTLVDGSYQPPVKLGTEINSGSPDMDPFIAPDESYIIFHSPRAGGYGENDLYISFKDQSGAWLPAMNMGPDINTASSEYCGRVSLNGKVLIFSRREPNKDYGKFFWVDGKFIDKLKQSVIN